MAANAPASLRWILHHLVEETARHLGHLDVLCELADGRTGEEPSTSGPLGFVVNAPFGHSHRPNGAFTLRTQSRVRLAAAG